MCVLPANPATSDLVASSSGDASAASRLMPRVYDQLRALAAKYLRGERAHATIGATDLVHEAYLRLVDVDRIDWRGKTHFYAMVATQMRRVLVERARAAATHKRGRKPRRVTLDDGLGWTPATAVEILTLNEALDKMGQRHPRRASIAEMRIFASMEMKEMAAVVQASERTVRVEWMKARATLARRLGRPVDSA